jgi:hypothetical protein
MKIVATTICAIMLAGCASDLPYSIAIGNPSKDEIGPGHKECVLRLDDIVEKVALDYSSSKLHNVKSLQGEFEKQLHKDTEALNGCKSGYHPIEEVAKKWLTSYALDATDPDQGLDRFREYVRSAQLVQDLAKHQIKPDRSEDKTYLLIEEPSQLQS